MAIRRSCVRCSKVHDQMDMFTIQPPDALSGEFSQYSDYMVHKKIWVCVSCIRKDDDAHSA